MLPLLRLVLVCVMVCMMAGHSPRAMAAEDLVHVAMSAPVDARLESVELRTTWLGEDVRTQLEDPMNTGVYASHLRGAPVRVLPLSIWVKRQGHIKPEEIYQGLELLGDGGGQLAWTYSAMPAPRAERVNHLLGAGPQARAIADATQLGTAVAWDLGVLLFVLGLVALRRPRGRGPGLAWVDRPWATPALLFVSAVAWTWPAALAGDRFMVGRHFDLLHSLWSLSAAPRLLPTLHDLHTAWPLGVDYSRFDSFSLLPLAAPLPNVDPVTLHGWAAILGVWLSAWAAAWFASVLGARRPWGLLAGLVFGLSGLSASVLLEGHVYHVLNPWLPLFAGAWWRACSGTGRRRDGVLAGVASCLTLWTSAYLGLSAMILALGFLFAGLARHGRDKLQWPALAAALTVAVGALPYVLLFVGAQDAAGNETGQTVSRISGATLTSLLAATDEQDLLRNSQALSLSGLALALALVSPLVLPQRAARKTLVATAGVALVLAMGATFSTDDHSAWFPLPLAPILAAGADSFLRFPARLFWGGLLCLAGLAAWVASRLETRAGTVTRLLLVLALVEPFLLIRLPQRQQTQRSFVPSAYAAAQGPVLDLFPEAAAPPQLDHLFTGLACFNQTRHGLTIADDCLSVDITNNPRYRLDLWLVGAALGGQGASAKARLESLGFGAVAFHADWFSPGDRARIRAGLVPLDPDPVQTTDGGEALMLYRLQPQTDAVVASASALWDSLETAAPRQLGGKPLVEAAQSLRVEAQGPNLLSGGSPLSIHYQARLRTDQGVDRTLDLTNDGTTASDLPGDSRWLADFAMPLPPVVQLDLVRLDGPATTTLWSGPLTLGASDDRVTFRDQGDGTARPLAVAPAEQPAPAPLWSGRVAALGWANFLAFGGLGVALLRRRSPPPDSLSA